MTNHSAVGSIKTLQPSGLDQAAERSRIDRSDPVPRLLVVDDDLLQRKLIGAIARQAGYQPVEAASFDEANQLLSDDAFDCITLDLSLGKNDGVELLRVLAKQGHAAPIIVISGCEPRILNSTMRFAESVGLNLAKALSKPVDLAELRNSLKQEKRIVRPPNRPFEPQFEISRDGFAAALERNEFFLEFQPKIELATDRVVGCEALARWNSSEYGCVPPSIFIPLAERWQLIEPLTEHILRTAVGCMGEVVAQDKSFSVAVNVSPSSLSDVSFPDKIEAILGDSGFSPKALTLEVTEGAVMADVAKATDILVRLRIKGFGLAIDDFGTGYSSLTTLVRMPFDEMKLDRSFVKDCHADPDMAKIVQACLRLGQEFEMKTVAEGVDNSLVDTMLRASGCDIGQGFYFSRPLDIGRLKSWLAARPIALSA